VPFIEGCRQIKPPEPGEGPERLQAVFEEFLKDRDMDPAGYPAAFTTYRPAKIREDGRSFGATVSGGRRDSSLAARSGEM
jgi:hypothetical protein